MLVLKIKLSKPYVVANFTSLPTNYFKLILTMIIYVCYKKHILINRMKLIKKRNLMMIKFN